MSEISRPDIHGCTFSVKTKTDKLTNGGDLGFEIHKRMPFQYLPFYFTQIRHHDTARKAFSQIQDPIELKTTVTVTVTMAPKSFKGVVGNASRDNGIILA